MSPYKWPSMCLITVALWYNREERLMSVLAFGEGRCGGKGCVEKEEEKQKEVGITGTFLIFYILIQSIRVATQQFQKY